MYTHLHTTEWNHSKEYSNDSINYFINRIDGSIVAELHIDGGFEYYACSDVQMMKNTVGNYLGCKKSNALNGREANIMVYDHEHQVERTVSLNDEIYLD